MKRWLLIAVIAVAQAGGLGWATAQGADGGVLRGSKPDVRKAVVATIEGQLAAFRAREVQRAYAWAAGALRVQTPLRQFLLIVETNYPEIWANTRAEIGVVRDNGVRATVLVQVYGQEVSAGYDYGLVKERDGVWRIESVLRHAPKKAEKV